MVPEKEEALEIGERMTDHFKSGMNHLTPVQEYMSKVPAYSENPYGDAQYVKFSIDGITGFQSDVEKVIENCGDNSYWSGVKTLAENLLEDVEEAVALFDRVGNSSSPTSTDISQARNSYLYILKAWSGVMDASSSVVKGL